MIHDSPVVECIGTVAEVQLWEVQELKQPGSTILGGWGGVVLGNDAVIVARHLLGKGYMIRCQLLDATRHDIDAVHSILGAHEVIAIGGGNPTGSSRSLCLETSGGRRSWIISRFPDPQVSLQRIRASMVYVDYYSELRAYLDVELPRAVEPGLPIFVNLSSVTQNIPSFPFKAAVVQASVGSSLTEADALALASRVRESSQAERVVLTLGAKGAVLAMSDGAWHCSPGRSSERPIIGAGAIFSSELIAGLFKGLDHDLLIHSAVQNTAQKLRQEGL